MIIRPRRQSLRVLAPEHQGILTLFHTEMLRDPAHMIPVGHRQFSHFLTLFGT